MLQVVAFHGDDTSQVGASNQAITQANSFIHDHNLYDSKIEHHIQTVTDPDRITWHYATVTVYVDCMEHDDVYAHIQLLTGATSSKGTQG